MAHYLHRHFADDAEVHVLHDLRLRDPEQPEQTGDAGRCQIDHLLIHRWGMFIIESKSVTSEVRVRPDGSGGVLNPGRHFDAAQSDWPALCRRIEEVLGGQLQLAPDCPPALESHAQHIAAQLLARHGELRVDGAPPQGQDVQHVDVDSLELIRPRSVGVEHMGLWAMDQLGLRLVPAPTRHWSITARRRHRLDHRAHGTPGLRARHPALARRTKRPGRAARRGLRNDGTDAPVSRLRCADGAPRSHRAPSVRPGDGPVRPAPHGHALRPDQYLLRRRGGRTTQGTTRTLQGKTHRLPAPHPGAGARRQRLRASLAGLRRRLRESGETASWTTLRRILEGQQRITATFRRCDGRTLHVRKATRAEAPQQAIYDALGVGSAPGGIRKNIV